MGIGLVILAGLIALFLLWPLSFSDLSSRADPTQSYPEAMQRVESIQAAEREKPLSERGRTIVMTHGVPTDRVFVLLHGLTNAPEQFRQLGQQLYDQGANVVIPRLAHHGLADRMNTEQGDLRASDLINQAETGLDIATGLGKHITLVGLSVTGVAAAWIAQHRPEPDTVFLLAPFFGPKPVSDPLTPVAARALSRIANGFVWWDGTAKENLQGSDQVYPRFATRQIGETLRLGLDVAASDAPMKAPRVHVVLTEADKAVNNHRTLRLMERWKSESPDTEFTLSVFPEADGVPHDFIDPNQLDAQTERVYPKLLEWLNE
jgi:carboxylesterase